MQRRDAIRAALAVPMLSAFVPRAEGKDYADAAEVLRAIDELEAAVAARLRAIADARPGAKAFAASCLADQDRHRRGRERLRRRLRLEASSPAGREVRSPLSIVALREAQESLVHAHAEGLAALGDAVAVDALARDMVTLSRQLTVIELWLESEAAGA
jgi:hypothetical protein